MAKNDFNQLLIVHYDNSPALVTFDKSEAGTKLKALQAQWPGLPWVISVGITAFGEAVYAGAQNDAWEEFDEH